MKAFSYLVLACAAGAIVAPQGAAATELRENAGVACTGRTSIDDSALTKTAKGIYNNTSSTVDITCSLPTVALHVSPNDSQWIDQVRILFGNPTAVSRTVTCFYVPSVWGSDNHTYHRSLAMAPNGGGYLTYQMPRDRFTVDRIGVACKLPAHGFAKEVEEIITEFQFQEMQ